MRRMKLPFGVMRYAYCTFGDRFQSSPTSAQRTQFFSQSEYQGSHARETDSNLGRVLIFMRIAIRKRRHPSLKFK